MKKDKYKITITIVNNNQCRLDGPLVVLNKLYKLYEVKHPNAFYISQYSKSGWDGIIHYINDRGMFKIGLTHQIYTQLTQMGHTVTMVDERQPISVTPVIPKKVGNLIPRGPQLDVIKTIINHKVGDVPFYIGVQDLSVNFGKSLIMAGLFLAFKGKLKTLLLTNDSDWLDQSKKEFVDLLPDENITFIRGGKVRDWGNFSIGMVQSISQNMAVYHQELSKIDMVLIDECDLIDNKTYKKVIERLFNARVRIGLSGTVYLSELKKDRVFMLNVKSFIGSKMTEVRLKDTIKMKTSTKVVIKLIPTLFNKEKKKLGYYPDEYAQVISENKKSYNTSLQRVIYNANLGRIPMLVVTKYIKHCELLYKFYKSKLASKYKIAYVHSGVNPRTRKKTIEDFRAGKIDILISNSFISRGKNFPLLRYLQNTASMDSNEKTIQLLGRLVRTHQSKSKAYMDDIAYNGKYLSRHAKHRKNYYLKEGLKVIKLKREL